MVELILVHDWTMQAFGGLYGFTQWGISPCSCSVYFGHLIWVSHFSAPVVVGTLLIAFCMTTFLGIYLSRRIVDRLSSRRE